MVTATEYRRVHLPIQTGIVTPVHPPQQCGHLDRVWTPTARFPIPLHQVILPRQRLLEPEHHLCLRRVEGKHHVQPFHYQNPTRIIHMSLQNQGPRHVPQYWTPQFPPQLPPHLPPILLHMPPSPNMFPSQPPIQAGCRAPWHSRMRTRGQHPTPQVTMTPMTGSAPPLGNLLPQATQEMDSQGIIIGEDRASLGTGRQVASFLMGWT